MTTVQPVQGSTPVTSGTVAPRIPVPASLPVRPSEEVAPVHLSPPDRALAGRLAEKESLFEAARKVGHSVNTATSHKRSLEQAKARLEQIKLYSPYPADESPRAALIRRLIRLQQPPGDPGALDLGVTKVTPDISDQDVRQALDTVQAARAQLTQVEVPTTPVSEDPSPAIQLSVGLGHTWPRETGISSSPDVHYLRTL